MKLDDSARINFDWKTRTTPTTNAQTQIYQVATCFIRISLKCEIEKLLFSRGSLRYRKALFSKVLCVFFFQEAIVSSPSLSAAATTKFKTNTTNYKQNCACARFDRLQWWIDQWFIASISSSLRMRFFHVAHRLLSLSLSLSHLFSLFKCRNETVNGTHELL